MKSKGDYYSDVWQKNEVKGTKIPPRAELVCVHQIVVQALLDVNEYLYLHQTTIRNELWCISEAEPLSNTLINENTLRGEHTAVLLLSEPYSQDKVACSLRMLNELLRARMGFVYPQDQILPGLVTEDDYRQLVHDIRHEIDHNREQAVQLKSLIISEATRLGLNPEPPLLNQQIWSAKCPGTSHKLYINANRNEFGCGYCQIKGNHQKLADLVKRRGE